MSFRTFFDFDGFSVRTTKSSGRLSRLFYAIAFFLIAWAFLAFTEQSIIGRLIDVYSLILGGLFLILRFVIFRNVNLKSKVENSSLGRFLWSFSYLYLYAIVFLIFFYGL